MDAIARIQPSDPTALTQVDSGIMRMCATAVLVHSITIRHLPASVHRVRCAISLCVNGTTFTTPAFLAEEETDEDKIYAAAVMDSASLSRPATASSLSPRSTVADVTTSRRGAAAARTFQVSVQGLQLLFPGSRHRAQDMREGAPTVIIENPREFPTGVQVSVHSADHSHVFGSALCKTSGEPATLSYPRGEVSIDFRVYPCANGAPIMAHLFQKECIASKYFGAAAAPVSAALLTNGSEATAAAEADNFVAAGDPSEAAAAVPEEEEEEGRETESAPAQEETPAEEAAPVEETAEAEEAAPTQEETPAAEASPVEETAEAEEAAPAEEECQPVVCDEEVAPAENAPVESVEEAQEEQREEADETALALATAPVTTLRPPSAAREFDDALADLIPCYTEAQRKAVFELYQSQEGANGYLSRRQLLHFIRSHAAYADAYQDDEELLRWALAPYITKRDEIEATATATPITDAEKSGASEDEAEAVAEQQQQQTDVAVESEQPQRPTTPRVDVAHLYYRPSAPNGSNGHREACGRLGQRASLDVGFDLFSLISLKLAKA